jgi:hypothetical protein
MKSVKLSINVASKSVKPTVSSKEKSKDRDSVGVKSGKKLKKKKKLKSGLLRSHDSNPVESAKALQLAPATHSSVIETKKPESPDNTTMQSAPDPARKYVDLHPWNFKLEKVGKIRRKDWNKLVSEIIEANKSESDSECSSLHEELHRVYQENQTLKEKYGKLLDVLKKHHREIEATFL